MKKLTMDEFLAELDAREDRRAAMRKSGEPLTLTEGIALRQGREAVEHLQTIHGATRAAEAIYPDDVFLQGIFVLGWTEAASAKARAGGTR